jgi:hypothetical protein
LSVAKQGSETLADELNLLDVLVQRLHEHHPIRAGFGIRAKSLRDLLD